MTPSFRFLLVFVRVKILTGFLLMAWLIVGSSRADSDPASFQQLRPDLHQFMNDGGTMVDITNFPLGNPEDLSNEIPGEPLTPADFERAKKVSIEAPPKDKLGGDPIEIAGLFEGDIAGVSPLDVKTISLKSGGKGANQIKPKNAIRDKTLRWPDGVIPYVISASFSQYDRSVIARAILEYHNLTCIRYAPRVNQRDYIHIMPGSGCSSGVGRSGGAQPVSLGGGCVYVGIVIHELMHAMGFWHEQSRADRDDFITIKWDNIIDGMGYNFQKYTMDKIQYLGAPYDTDSVMHYDAFAFAKNREIPTILAKKGGAHLGQRRGFSQVDLMKLNRLYDCNNTGSAGSSGTTTIAPEVSTELPGKCEDSHKHCQYWSGTGECTKNKAWMNVSCRKSCKQCGVECDNHNVYCDQWAKSGECEKNREYMTIYCPKACKLCSSGSSGCVDENRYCSAWADRGQCKANADYMLAKCKKSCGKC